MISVAWWLLWWNENGYNGVSWQTIRKYCVWKFVAILLAHTCMATHVRSPPISRHDSSPWTHQLSRLNLRQDFSDGFPVWATFKIDEHDVGDDVKAFNAHNALCGYLDFFWKTRTLHAANIHSHWVISIEWINLKVRVYTFHHLKIRM